MKIKMFINGFNTLVFENVSNISFFGSTEGYDWNDRRTKNSISFRTNNPDECIAILKSAANSDQKFADSVKLTTKFESWEKDTRPQISIQFAPGSIGFLSPPSFEIVD